MTDLAILICDLLHHSCQEQGLKQKRIKNDEKDKKTDITGVVGSGVGELGVEEGGVHAHDQRPRHLHLHMKYIVELLTNMSSRLRRV